MLYTYDVFDTCLVRSCGNPLFVFDLLAERILGHTASHEEMADFSKQRIEGERLARMKYESGTCEEVTMGQIYECCEFSLAIDKSDIMKAELEIESRVLTPVYKMRKDIEIKRKEGNRIGFVSDMYLPPPFILMVLKKYGFYKNGDFLYVSSACKLKKSTGNLFKYIKKDQNISYEGWVHCGDNRISDYLAPRKLGIKCYHKILSYSSYEHKMMQLDLTCTRMNQHLMSGMSRSVRLQMEDSFYVSFASDFIAPLLVPYVFHVLRDAKRRGLKHLYFASRDGFILYRIALQFSSYFTDIDCHYLRVSRQSCYLPSIDDFSCENLGKYFKGKNNDTVATVLERMNLSDFKYDYTLDNLRGFDDIIHSLMKDKAFLPELKKKSTEQRILLLEYLKNEGLSRTSCAFVDIRGGRTCQKAINYLMESNFGTTLYGYYLETTADRHVGDDYNSLFFSERYGLNKTNLCFTPQDVFEQYFCMTDQGRTLYYFKENDSVKPFMKYDNVSRDYRKKVSEINTLVCEKFAAQYRMLMSQSDPVSTCYSALSVWSFFYNAPEFDYLKVFNNFELSASTQITYPLLERMSFWRMWKLRKHVQWMAGTIVYNFPFKSLLTFLLRFRYCFLNY